MRCVGLADQTGNPARETSGPGTRPARPLPFTENPYGIGTSGPLNRSVPFASVTAKVVLAAR
jgi:hypothetical protein